ncbi:MAG: tetratricopeptide repeat protein [Actinobacteria bacterium]|nr:tetratricopeptide repeat protein [Actinomycetota bacterium]
MSEIYKQIDREKQKALLGANKAFEGLAERDKALITAANIGIITCPARLSTRLEKYRRLMDELDSMLKQAGISAIDEMIGAERTLLKQAWWDKFLEDWKEKWAIRSENDIGSWGHRWKKLQPYVYDFGYFCQTPANYRKRGVLKGSMKEVSWRVDIKSNSVAPIMLPISHELEKGLMLASRGRNEEAIEEFNAYIKVRPNDPVAYGVRGDSYDDMGQFGKAINDYSTLIELEPKLAEAYHKRAVAYAEIGSLEKSIKDFDKAIELYPENAEYYFNRCVTYHRLGDRDKVIDDCTKAIDLDRNYAKAYYSRGIAYGERGEYDKAISDYNVAIKLQPEFMVDVYFNRGGAYQAKGELEKALDDFKWVKKNVSDRESIEVVEQKIRDLTKVAKPRTC